MVPRRFAPYRHIADDVAARLAAGRSSHDPLGAWAAEVIVPSRGVADAVAQALLQRLPAGVAGLRLHTLDDLAARLLASSGQFARIASDAERRLAMRVAARSVDEPLIESRGMSSMLERAYRDTRDSGLFLADVVRRKSAAARSLRNGQRTDAILRTWAEYEQLIAQLGAIDAADRMAEATRLVTTSLPMQLLAGFYDMTGAQLRLVEALLRAGRIEAVWVPTEMPFGESFVRALSSFVEIAQGETPKAAPPAATVTQYETKAVEIRSVCSEIGSLLADGVAPNEIGVVARSMDAYDRHLLERFAREQRFTTSPTQETPLASQRIGRGAITLLRLRERGFLRSDVFELLRDGVRLRTRIRIDEADLATRRAGVAAGTSEDLQVLRSRSRSLADYLDVLGELEELTRELNVEFVAKLSSLFRIETVADAAAAEKLDTIATLFRRAAAWNRGLDINSVVDAIEQETVAMDEAPREDLPSIWAGDVMRFRGRSFRYLFAISMGDDVFPQRRVEDPLLPDSDRRLLGIREIGDGTEEENLLFSLLHDGTTAELRFSFAAGDGLGKVLRPSRYLRGVARRETPAPIRSDRSGATRRQLQLLARSGTAGVFDGSIGALSAELQAKLLSLSPTQLEDFGECPQKFLLKHLLGVTDIDDPERELQISAREKGTLDHRILEKFYRTLSDDDFARIAAVLPALPREIIARLEETIEVQFDAAENEAPPFNATVRGMERRSTRRLLTAFVADDMADLVESGLKPQFFEYRFGAKHQEFADHKEGFVVDTGAVPLRVEGTIDRIDAGAGGYRIVDYKSGKALRHVNLGDKVDRGVRLQLALYAMAVAEFFAVDASKVSATIKPLVAADAKADKYAFSLEEKKERVLETLRIFMSAITAGVFPAFPNENDNEFNSCKYCPVNHSCRTLHDHDETYALAASGDPRTLLGGHD